MTIAIKPRTGLDGPQQDLFRHAAPALAFRHLTPAKLKRGVMILSFLTATLIWFWGVQDGLVSTPTALDPALARLIVAMAVIKALFALPLLVVVARHWIQTLPISGAMLPLTGYWVLGMGLVSGIGLIGTLQGVAAGALLYHCSFGCLLVLLAINKGFQNTALTVVRALAEGTRHSHISGRSQESR